MKKISFSLVVCSSLLFSGCTPKSILASMSADATKEDMQEAINICPTARDEIAQCLIFDQSLYARMDGRCTRPLTKKNLKNIIKNCTDPLPSNEKKRKDQLKDFYSIDPKKKEFEKDIAL